MSFAEAFLIEVSSGIVINRGFHELAGSLRVHHIGHTEMWALQFHADREKYKKFLFQKFSEWILKWGCSKMTATQFTKAEQRLVDSCDDRRT